MSMPAGSSGEEITHTPLTGDDPGETLVSWALEAVEQWRALQDAGLDPKEMEDRQLAWWWNWYHAHADTVLALALEEEALTPGVTDELHRILQSIEDCRAHTIGPVTVAFHGHSGEPTPAEADEVQRLADEARAKERQRQKIGTFTRRQLAKGLGRLGATINGSRGNGDHGWVELGGGHTTLDGREGADFGRERLKDMADQLGISLATFLAALRPKHQKKLKYIQLQ